MSENLPDPNESVHAALQLSGDVDEVRAFYDDWAATYDATAGYIEGYAAKEICVELLNEVLEPGAGALVDVGCGTGIVGELLRDRGYSGFDGFDLSEEMACLAREKGYYRNVWAGIDLTRPLPDHLVGSYDAAVVCGVFTVGHVPPDTLRQVVTLLRPGGHIVMSVRQAYEQAENYRQASERMVATGVVDLVRSWLDAPYTPDSTGDYFVYRRPE